MDTTPASIRAAPLKFFHYCAAAAASRPLSVMGIGSWSRSRWMLQALQEHINGRTFANTPVNSGQIGEAKLRMLAELARILRERHRV